MYGRPIMLSLAVGSVEFVSSLSSLPHGSFEVSVVLTEVFLP